jgi:chromosome segregation ATPase
MSVHIKNMFDGKKAKSNRDDIQPPKALQVKPDSDASMTVRFKNWLDRKKHSLMIVEMARLKDWLVTKKHTRLQDTLITLRADIESNRERIESNRERIESNRERIAANRKEQDEMNAQTREAHRMKHQYSVDKLTEALCGLDDQDGSFDANRLISSGVCVYWPGLNSSKIEHKIA